MIVFANCLNGLLSTTTQPLNYSLLDAFTDMSDVQLTAGVCKRFAESKGNDPHGLEGSSLILQVLSIKMIPSSTTTTDRYRMILSDGEHFLQSMLATNLNHTVTDSQVVKHSVIRVDNFTFNVVQDRRYGAIRASCQT